jgi:hypothetical protein
MRGRLTIRATLTSASVEALQDQARSAGEAATVHDCATILCALGLNQARPHEFYNQAGAATRSALDRVVALLQLREAASELQRRKLQLDLFHDERCVGCGGEPIKSVRICESCAEAALRTRRVRSVGVSFSPRFEYELILKLERDDR